MSSSTPTVSVLIASYNTREMTLACLRSIYSDARGKNFEVIVVDNGSSDGSAGAIEAEFPAVELIRSPENLGFARANNMTSQRAAASFILLLNSDTLVRDCAIDRLLAFAHANLHAGIWGGRTVFADGLLNPKSCWRFMSLWSLFAQAVGLSALLKDTALFNPEAYGGWRRDSVREVDFVTGCFLLIRRELWERLGGFDERFFMYAEEADLCYRARRLGARPLFTPHATIIHHGGGSEPARAAKVEKLFAGKATFIDKHWAGPRKTVALRLLELHCLTRAAGYAVLARLSRSEQHQTTAREWKLVWQARHRWMAGYQASSMAQSQLRHG